MLCGKRRVVTKDPKRILERGNQNIGQFVAIIVHQEQGYGRILWVAVVLNVV